MNTIDKVNIGGQEYGITGILLRGVCDTASDIWNKTVTITSDNNLVPGMLISIDFTYGNSVGEAVEQTLYSSDQINYYTDEAMTNAYTIAPENNRDIRYTGTGNVYKYYAFPTITINGKLVVVKDSRGHYAGRGCWNDGDKMLFFYDGTDACIQNSDVRQSEESYTIKSDGSKEYKAVAVDGKLSLSGGTMTGPLGVQGEPVQINGSELQLRTNSSSNDDSSDIVFYHGNGAEKARIFTPDNMSTSNGLLEYRSMSKDGTVLKSTRLATIDSFWEIYNSFISEDSKSALSLFSVFPCKNTSPYVASWFVPAEIGRIQGYAKQNITVKIDFCVYAYSITDATKLAFEYAYGSTDPFIQNMSGYGRDSLTQLNVGSLPWSGYKGDLRSSGYSFTVPAGRWFYIISYINYAVTSFIIS